MKICIIVSNSLRKDPRVIKQIQCAINEGFDVHFVGYRDVHYNKAFLDNVGCQISMVDLGDQYVGQLKSTIKKIYRRLMEYYLPIKMMVKIKPDLIHANDFDTLIQSYIAAKLCKCKVIYDSHEIYAENIGISNKKLQKNIIITIERFLVKRVCAMISVSNSAAEYFRNKYSIDLPIVITNCPYKSDIEVDKTKETYGFEVLYQGLFIKGRGYEEFVKSAKYFDKNIFAVLRGYGSIESELRKIIADEHLEDLVRFDGPVEIRDIISKASESHLGVVLTQPVNINFQLTVSNKIFEYLHAGLPLLISDIPEHRYLNDKFNFGIILKDFSPHGIANCINELVLDPEKYALLRKNAIIAADTLIWENESKKLIELYRKFAKPD